MLVLAWHQDAVRVQGRRDSLDTDCYLLGLHLLT